LIEAGASFETLKMHGKWKSNTVAQSYVKESIISKNRISSMIASAMSSSEGETSKTNYQTVETDNSVNFRVTSKLDFMKMKVKVAAQQVAAAIETFTAEFVSTIDSLFI
jgi:uncharacterized protein YfiM (DUF2279 family)